MSEPFITARIKPASLRLLRLIAAATGEKIYEVVARLMSAEAKRLGLSKHRTEK